MEEMKEGQIKHHSIGCEGQQCIDCANFGDMDKEGYAVCKRDGMLAWNGYTCARFVRTDSRAVDMSLYVAFRELRDLFPNYKSEETFLKAAAHGRLPIKAHRISGKWYALRSDVEEYKAHKAPSRRENWEKMNEVERSRVPAGMIDAKLLRPYFTKLSDTGFRMRLTRRQLPVTIHKIGRLLYVERDEVNEWLANTYGGAIKI